MKLFMLILSVIAGFIIMIYFIRSSKKSYDKVKNEYFYLRLRQCEINYEFLKLDNEFKKYPTIEKQIMNVIKVIKGKNSFDYKEIKIVRVKIREFLNDDNMDFLTKLFDEKKDCDNKRILELLDDINNVKSEIINYKMPIRNKLSQFIFMSKMQILYIIAIFVKGPRDNELIKEKDEIKEVMNDDFSSSSGLTFN